MSRAKTERLLNLTICLLAARRFLTKDQIRAAVPGYSDSPEAFERMFERDKDELREMGVPVLTGSNSVLFDDEVGYRIDRDTYALPEVHFDAEEMGVLALAARAWQQATLAAPASQALLKLKAYGVDTDEVALTGLEPRVDTGEQAFPALWQAVRDARPVRFTYQRPGAEPTARQVEPWGIVSWHGRWYLVGHDRDREAPRVFRVSRIVGAVELLGEPGSVQVPAGIDVHAMVADTAADREQRGEARLLLREGSGAWLRRQASRIDADAGALAGEPGWDAVTVPYSDRERLVDTVLGLGDDALVLEPDDLRAEVVGQLRALVAATSTRLGAGGPS